MLNTLRTFAALAFFLIASVAAFAGDGKSRLPELDPGKSIYQRDPGWICDSYDKVRLPDAKTEKQAELEAKIDRIKADTESYKSGVNEQTKQRAQGHFWIKIGAGLFVAGAFMFVALIKMGAEYFGALGSFAGIGCICYGAVIAKLAGHETAIAWGAGAFGVTVVAVWFCKGNSLVEKIKAVRNKKKA